MPEVLIHNDEPASMDFLNRRPLAKALSSLVLDCDTPLVIGLYGGWGTGKTTLMRLVGDYLDGAKTRPIWFDAWQHQLDESPAVALLHAAVDEFGLDEEGKKLLTVIAAAFGSALLHKTTNLGIEDIDKLGQRFEEERFQVREARIRLQMHFRKVIEKARGKEQRRIIFFIDDLDRCDPQNMLKMLEALKLYLNFPGCVYFLAVDQRTLERGIKSQFQEVEVQETHYLDKIVQLPITLPPVSSRFLTDFVGSLLPVGLHSCQSLLVAGLENNAREIKRVVNILIFNHHLATSLGLRGYDPRILALLLLIQHRSPALFSAIAKQPPLLTLLVKRDGPMQEAAKLYEEHVAKDDRLCAVLNRSFLPALTFVEDYIFLTGHLATPDTTEVEVEARDLNEVVDLHRRWLFTRGREGQKAILNNSDLRRATLASQNLRMAEFTGANLQQAVLKGCDLRRALLRGANLEDALLWGANLREADMFQAELAKADLRGADLRGAKLSGANLRGTNLTTALGLELDQIESALTDSTTMLPPRLQLALPQRTERQET